MEVSSASMKVASVTVPAITQGLTSGFCGIDHWVLPSSGESTGGFCLLFKILRRPSLRDK
jgi:hypothetical protein